MFLQANIKKTQLPCPPSAWGSPGSWRPPASADLHQEPEPDNDDNELDGIEDGIEDEDDNDEDDNEEDDNANDDQNNDESDDEEAVLEFYTEVMDELNQRIFQNIEDPSVKKCTILPKKFKMG